MEDVGLAEKLFGVKFAEIKSRVAEFVDQSEEKAEETLKQIQQYFEDPSEKTGQILSDVAERTDDVREKAMEYVGNIMRWESVDQFMFNRLYLVR